MNDINWIDWSLKDGSSAASPNAPTYAQELSEWTRGLIALRKRWTHFRKSDFADYAPNPRSQPGDPANDGRLSYAWEGPATGAPSQLATIAGLMQTPVAALPPITTSTINGEIQKSAVLSLRYGYVTGPNGFSSNDVGLTATLLMLVISRLPFRLVQRLLVPSRQIPPSVPTSKLPFWSSVMV